jgi:DNA-binding SARP family transcriptional activator
VKFSLLGPLEIRQHEQLINLGGSRTRTLISALLLRANQTPDTQWLMRVMWPTDQPVSASANLRQYVAKVRQMLRSYSLDGAARLCSTATGYRLEVGRDELDLTIFADLVQAGREALAARDPGAARACLYRAVRLWRGELCEGLSHYPELEIERAYWAEMRLLAMISLQAARLDLGEHREATAELQRLSAEHPLHEELRGLLMLSMYRCHRRSDALEVYRQTRSMLVAELGIEPGPHLQDLQCAILADDISLVSAAVAELTQPGRLLAAAPTR